MAKKYSIKDGNPNEKVLLINGTSSRCPFTPPFPVQGIGGISMSSMVCTTNCPHAAISKEDDGKDYYSITCSGTKIRFLIEYDEVSEEIPNITPFSVH
jgi:hypothetical protein